MKCVSIFPPTLIIAVLVLSLMTGCRKEPRPQQTAQSKPAPAELNVAAAADLQFALNDLAARFREQHPDVDLKITYGSSGNFFAQLSNGAPFDLFLSADSSYPEQLAEKGLADKSSAFKYGMGRIVLWAPKDSKFDPAGRKMQALLDPALKRVAVANPRHAPYGRAAEASLKKQQLWDPLQPKIVLGDNIAQTAQFVQSGAADVGIIALSLALSPSMKDAGTYYEIPREDYPALIQEGVILSRAKNPAAAEAFRTLIMSPDGQTLLQRYGFTRP